MFGSHQSSIIFNIALASTSQTNQHRHLLLNAVRSSVKHRAHKTKKLNRRDLRGASPCYQSNMNAANVWIMASGGSKRVAAAGDGRRATARKQHKRRKTDEITRSAPWTAAACRSSITYGIGNNRAQTINKYMSKGSFALWII